MKKVLFVCLITLFTAFGIAKAAGTSYLMIVEMTAGQPQEYNLSDTIRVSFSSTMMDVYVGGVLFHSFERLEVKDVHFDVKGGAGQGEDPDEQVVTEIDETPVMRFQYVDNATVRIEGIETTGIAVYDIAGRQQPASIRPEANTTVISLKTLPAGIYVIKTSQTAYKIVKR